MNSIDRAIQLAQEIGATQVRLDNLKSELESMLTNKMELPGKPVRNVRADILSFVRRTGREVPLRDIISHMTNENENTITYYVYSMLNQGLLTRARRGHYAIRESQKKKNGD